MGVVFHRSGHQMDMYLHGFQRYTVTVDMVVTALAARGIATISNGLCHLFCIVFFCMVYSWKLVYSTIGSGTPVRRNYRTMTQNQVCIWWTWCISSDEVDNTTGAHDDHKD